MKTFGIRFRISTIFIIFALSLLFIVPLSAGQLVTHQQSMRQREMNAARQLREYHQRQAVAQKKALGGELSSVRPRVGISLNRTSSTTSSIFFYDNFEASAHIWTTQLYGGTTDDLWHRTTLNASSPTHSYWAGIDGQGDYNTGRIINTALVSEPIALTGAIGPITLMFAENYETEQGWDDCMVDVSSDNGSTWTHLRGGYGAAPSGSSGGWTITSLDLTAYSGQTVLIRYYFYTFDANFNNFPGWFVDDIVVFDQGGIIEGRKFFDVNNNGVKDPGERGIKDWIITAAGPVTITTTTNVRGHYLFTLPLGTYTVSETFEPNWTQKYPLSGTWTINLSTPDTVVDSIHFGNYTQASFINGTKYNDINRNGTFDGGDTVLPNWKIVLSDTNGNMIDYDLTDSLGQYSLYIFQPGVYDVSEVGKQGWVESYPSSESYRITIPDLNTVSNGNDFGNYFDDSVNTIMGQKFNDVNRNGIKDPHEAGIAGFTIKLSGTKSRTVKTDSSGFYQFLSLPAGNYKIKEVPQMGWWQSFPESTYSVTCYSGELIDTLDFGNYAISTGSIAGMKYNDLNGNGGQDSGETGLSGWTMNLTGSTYFGSSVFSSATTDVNGNYQFSGLWPGNYNLSEVFRTEWRQTQPDHLQPYKVNLGVEQNLTGMKFGNHRDSTFSLAFRTFLPESLAMGRDKKGKHLPIAVKPYKMDFISLIGIGDTTSYPPGPKIVRVRFTVPVAAGTLSSNHGTVTAADLKGLTFDITYDPAIPGPSDSLTGSTVAPKPEQVKWIQWRYTSTPNLKMFGAIEWNFPRVPMPTGVNVVQLAGGGLKVGLGGPHSVVHGTWKDVMKSLVDSHDRMQSGDPRCLATFANRRSIKNQQRALTPTQENNKLFAEAIALQTNIIASDMDITPGGFGNLIFDQGTGIDSLHPFNGKSIRAVAAMLDEFMSSVKDTAKTSVCRDSGALAYVSAEQIWETIRLIDSSFSGPLDTVSFATGLDLTPVRALSAVSFFRLDTSSTNAGVNFAHARPHGIPDVFTLNQNFPNPFNPSTEIDYYLPTQSIVTLKVYNVLGQEVATLVNHELAEAGSYQFQLSSATLNMASGVYFYRITAETVVGDDNPVKQVFTDVKKMILLK